MSRIASFLFIFIILTGCLKNDEVVFKGQVLNVKDSRFIVTVPKEKMDPEASYPEYEYFVNESTVFEGEIKNYKSIAIGDIVRIWEEGDNKERKIAKKVLVIRR